MRSIMAKAISYMKPDIDPNTRLYIPFNEGVGSVAKDYSQYGNHAQLTDVEWSNDGFNGAGKFNGSSSYGDCGANASLNLGIGAFTIELWLNSLTNSETYPAILDKSINCDWTGPSANTGIWLGYYTANDLRFELGDGSGGFDFISFGDLRNTGWIHISITVDAGTDASPKSIGYKNGKYLTQANRTMTGSVNCSNNLNVGQWRWLSRSFKSTINEVKIYKQIPNAAQIAADCYEVVCS